MATKTTDGKSEDGWEDAGFEEENQAEHGNTSLALDTHRQGDEDHDSGHEHHEDLTGLEVEHQTSGGKTANGEQTLANSISVTGSGVVNTGRLNGVADEVGGNTDLGTDIAELSSNAKEESVLLLEGLFLVTGKRSSLLGLEFHIGICDLGKLGEEEDDGQEENESSNAEVCPLNLGQIILGGVGEEDTAGKKWSNDRADSLERLGQFETELGESGRSASSDEGVRTSLERRQTGTDNEERATETAEGSVDGRRPEHQGTDTVDAQAGNEGPPVTELSHDPTGVGERADEVGTEVGTLQTTGFRGSNVEGGLELGVQNIEETVGETPEEEEDSDQGNGVD